MPDKVVEYSPDPGLRQRPREGGRDADKMTHRTLENLTHRFIAARDKANVGSVWPWVGTLIAFVSAWTSMATIPDEARQLLILSPGEWRGIYLSGAALALIAVTYRLSGVTASWLYDRDKTRSTPAADSRVFKWLRISCPADWVPTNVAAYVHLALDELRKEAADEATPVAR